MGILLVLAVAGLARSAGAGGPVTADERAHEVAASLRCPTCQGLSVADSGSPLARSMRDIIDEQIAAGRSNEEIRQYFVDRYGDWVLLAPRADAGGWVVWTVPAVAVLVGLLVVASLLRRREASGPVDAGAPVADDVPEPSRSESRRSQGLRWAAVGGVLAVSLGVLVMTNLEKREQGELATGNVTPLGAQTTAQGREPSRDGDAGSAPASRAQLREAVAKHPGDVRSRLALASAAFQAGQLAVTRAQAEAALAREPRNVDALMLRGLAAASPQDREGTTALRRFLRLAPTDHPAVPLVRGLLEEGP